MQKSKCQSNERYQKWKYWGQFSLEKSRVYGHYSSEIHLLWGYLTSLLSQRDVCANVTEINIFAAGKNVERAIVLTMVLLIVQK